MTEYIYYAKPKGAPGYTETIVLEMTRQLTADEKARLVAALQAQGQEFVRVFEYNGEAPDFAGTVRI